MNQPPTFNETPTARDTIQKMRNYNVTLTGLAKQGVDKMHTGNIEGLLQNFSMLMAGDYGNAESVEVPVDVVRNMGLFSSVTLSRLLHDRYKLEKTLGRPVVDTPLQEPSAEDLTKVVLPSTIEGEQE